MMCERAVEKYTQVIEFVPDQYKTQGMCNEAVEPYPCILKFVPDKYKTQMMCEKAFKKPWLLLLEYAPDYFKTQETCDKAVRDDPSSFQFVPDWFVTNKGVDMWYDKYYDDDGDYLVTEGDDDDKFFKWYVGYKKHKPQKAKIKE